MNAKSFYVDFSFFVSFFPTLFGQWKDLRVLHTFHMTVLPSMKLGALNWPPQSPDLK